MLILALESSAKARRSPCAAMECSLPKASSAAA